MLERLEQRQLLAASIEIAGGVLQLHGTEQADDVHVSIVQRASGKRVIEARVNGLVQSFGRKDVGTINVLALGGNDRVEIRELNHHNGSSIPTGVPPEFIGSVEAPVLVEGGAGNDTIISSVGNDTLNGDTGNDRVSGGKGNDRLLGGADADALSGGEGNDTLLGGGGTDSLFGDAGNDLLDGGEKRNDSVKGGPGADVVNEGAYDAAAGARVAFTGTVAFVELDFSPAVWRINGGADFRDGVDLDLNGFGKKIKPFKGKLAVITGTIEVRNVFERGMVRVLVIESIRAV